MAEQQLNKERPDGFPLKAKFKTLLQDESGSISLLLVFLFLITTITSLVIVDVADGYLAKRQLTQIAEAAAQTGSHQIDLTRYYSGGLIDSGMGYQLVPISCNSAILYAQRYLYSNTLRGNPIYMTGWKCQNERVMIDVRSEIRPLISLPIVVGSFGQRLFITSSVIATSVVR